MVRRGPAVDGGVVGPSSVFRWQRVSLPSTDSGVLSLVVDFGSPSSLVDIEREIYDVTRLAAPVSLSPSPPASPGASDNTLYISCFAPLPDLKEALEVLRSSPSSPTGIFHSDVEPPPTGDDVIFVSSREASDGD